MSRNRINMNATLVANIRNEVVCYIDENKGWPHKRKGVSRMRVYLERLDQLTALTDHDAEKIVIGDYLSTSQTGRLGNSTEMRDRIGEVIRMRKNFMQHDFLRQQLSEKLKLSLMKNAYQFGNDLLLDPILRELIHYKNKLLDALEEKNVDQLNDPLFDPIMKRLLKLKENLEIKLGIKLGIKKTVLGESEQTTLDKDPLLNEVLTPLWKDKHVLLMQFKEDPNQLTQSLNCLINRSLRPLLNRLLQPALDQKLTNCLDDPRPEHQALLTDRYDLEFEYSVQKEVFDNAVQAASSGVEVRRARISRCLLSKEYLPSEDRDLPFEDTLKGHLKRQVTLYQSLDNPPAKNKLIDGNALGRTRAAGYLQGINDHSEETLFIKMLRDFLYSDHRSALGNSTKLRNRIGDALCRFMGNFGELMLHRLNVESSYSANPFYEWYKQSERFRYKQTCDFIRRSLPHLLMTNRALFPHIVGVDRVTYGEKILQNVLRENTSLPVLVL